MSDEDGHDFRGVTHGAALCDVRVGLELRQTFVGLNLQDSRGGSCFAVVDVADCADVDVRFSALECAFSHLGW